MIRPGLPTSVGLHAVLMAAILFAWPGATPQEDATVVDAMPVELVPVGPTSQIRLGQKTAKPKDEIVANDVKQAPKENAGKRAGTDAREEPPPPMPEAKPAQPQKTAELPKPPEPKPEPPKPEPAKAEPVKAPPPKAEVPKMPEPKPDLPKEAEKAKDVGEGAPPKPKDPPKDTAALDKLLDEQKKADEKKAADAKAAADKAAKAAADAKAKAAADAKAKAVADAKAAADKAAKAAAEKAAAQTASTGAGKSFSTEISDVLNKNQTGSSSGKETKVASLGSPSGRLDVARMTQSETDALIGQIKKCWNPPIGAAEANIKVVLRFSLNRDGTLNGTPEPVAVPSHPAGVGLARSAQRALMQCGPYRMPPDKYTVWQLVEATFDPKDVF